MKAVYFYDPKTKIFISTDLINDDVDLPENCTTVQPINEDGSGMYDPTWDGEKWNSLSFEEFVAAHKNDTQPDESDDSPSEILQSITALAEQLSIVKLQNEQLQKAVTAMAMGGNQ